MIGEAIERQPEGFTLGVGVKAFNATIRDRRRELGLTQTEVAARAGVSNSTVSNIETMRELRRAPAVLRVLAVLGLDESAQPEWMTVLDADLQVEHRLDFSPEMLPCHGTMALGNGGRAALVAPEEQAQDPAELVSDRLSNEADVNMALELLEPIQRSILEMRYGLNGGDPETLDRVGKEFGLQRERVRQIENSALRLLQERCGVIYARRQP